MKTIRIALLSILGLALVAFTLTTGEAKADGTKPGGGSGAMRGGSMHGGMMPPGAMMNESDVSRMGETMAARGTQMDTMMDSMKSMAARARELDDTMAGMMKETPGATGKYEAMVQRMAGTMSAMAQLMQQTDRRYAEMLQSPSITNDPQMRTNLDYLRHQSDSLGAQMDRQMQAMEKLGQELEAHSPTASAAPEREQYP